LPPTQPLVGITPRFVLATDKTLVLKSIQCCEDHGIGNLSLVRLGAGRHSGYCHLEKLHNLENLPSTGFTVSCFPVKIERASAGWTRAVAIIDS